MKRLAPLLALALIGCQPPPPNPPAQATALLNEMSGRIRSADPALVPPPEVPQGPSEPDWDMIEIESARITELTFEDVVVGSGPLVEDERFVAVHYTGRFPDGYIFDTSHKPNTQPLHFRPVTRQYVDGFLAGLEGMRVGGRRVVTLPASMGYGADGNPPTVPPNTALVFELYVVYVGDA